MRRLTIVSLAAAIYVLASVAEASAEGGKTIASAPTVVFGQQEFGNTANGGHIETTCRGAGPLYYLFWDLPVTIDDSVTIDWEAMQKTELELYPIGTSDFNFGSGSSGFQTQTPAGNGKNEFNYFASEKSGTVILAFRNCYYEPGAFSFTAYVTHALSLGVPHVTALHRTGTLAIAVHNPEGGPINDPWVRVEVQIKSRGGWRRIGTGAVSNSLASVRYSIPSSLARQRVALRALASGSGYKPASSPSVTTRTR
ncbi:MAG TPA: hypothetical protein VK761_00725 [Solirubrobacteraceae bacterium]|nr:hypothetical protein [Solirubrobacteraceae bacterium]